MPLPKLYPLTFEPAYRSYIWGGRNLERLGRRLPPGETVAESWEISGHPDFPTPVDAGPLQGRHLTDLVREYGELLVGRRHHEALRRGRFPILIKLLDANDRLSVQVHPPDHYAAEHEAGAWGKTEMWYFLSAQPGAQIILGVRRGVTAEGFRQALARGALEECLHVLDVRAGDAVVVRAGVLHALLGGTLIAEIQQTSDITYRVYDWNRTGPDGKPRPLHVEKAMEVIDFNVVEPGPSMPKPLPARAGARGEVIGACEKFVVERWTMAAGRRWEGGCAGETFEILGVVEGAGALGWADGEREIRGVRFVLLPASLGEFRLKARSALTFLRIYPPA